MKPAREFGPRKGSLLGKVGDQLVPGVVSHPGIKVPDLLPGVRPIPHSAGKRGKQEGSPSWENYRSGVTGGSHVGMNISPDLSPLG